MSGWMRTVLGAAWDELPAVLRAHTGDGDRIEHGELDIEYPRALQPVLALLARLGALVDRPGRAVATRVERRADGARQHWRRTLRYADGGCRRFDSVREFGADGRLVEFVNPWLGLELTPEIDGSMLRHQGWRYLLCLGRRRLVLPRVLTPGRASIVETALDDRRFAMDFRLTHPWFGELFRYSGVFSVDRPPAAAAPAAPGPPPPA